MIVRMRVHPMYGWLPVCMGIACYKYIWMQS